MSEQKSATQEEADQSVVPAAPEQKATPVQMALGCGFIVLCLAICGGVFGWFSKGKTDNLAGIGVSRDAITSTFGKVGFGFQPGADSRGFPSEEATSPDGLSVIRLVGPKDNLVYVTIATELRQNATNEQRTIHALFAASLLKTTVPEWGADEITTWITDCMKTVKPFGQQQVEKEVKRGRVKFTVTTNPTTMNISVESKDW